MAAAPVVQKVCVKDVCAWCYLKTPHDNFEKLKATYRTLAACIFAKEEAAEEMGTLNCLVQYLIMQHREKTGETIPWEFKGIYSNVPPPPPPRQDEAESCAAAASPGYPSAPAKRRLPDTALGWLEAADSSGAAAAAAPTESEAKPETKSKREKDAWFDTLRSMPIEEWQAWLQKHMPAQLDDQPYTIKVHAGKNLGWQELSKESIKKLMVVFCQTPHRSLNLWMTDEHGTSRQYHVFCVGGYDMLQQNTVSGKWRSLKVVPKDLGNGTQATDQAAAAAAPIPPPSGGVWRDPGYSAPRTPPSNWGRWRKEDTKKDPKNDDDDDNWGGWTRSGWYS